MCNAQRARLVHAKIVVAFLAALSWHAAIAAADDATLLRVFLKDGSSLVSYGERARVEDRVVFSIPTAATPNPPLHLVNLSAERIDWERTNRYASSARATRYIETRAELDYAALSNTIADALNEVTRTTDPAQRLAIVERRDGRWPRGRRITSTIASRRSGRCW